MTLINCALKLTQVQMTYAVHCNQYCRNLAASQIAHSRSARIRLVTMAGKAAKFMVGGHVVEGISVAGQASLQSHPPSCMIGHIIRALTNACSTLRD